jgi:hypothetical protein
MQKGITEFLNYNQLPLSTPPASGVNPPAGSVFMWHTLDGSNNLVINYRKSDGTNLTFTAGGGGGVSTAVYHWEIPISTPGINYSTGAWTRFPLNTEQFSNITGADIDITTNIGRVTLPAGTYKISSHAARDNQGHMHIRVYDITNSVTLINGQQQQGDGGVVSHSATIFLSGVITLADSADIEFQYYTNNGTDETYTVVDAGIPRVSAFMDITKIG